MTKLPFKENSLLFAPMEGVTDEPYRIAIERAFPEWDYFATDFLRCPTVGKFNTKRIRQHYGEKVLKDKRLRSKTSYQILTASQANTNSVVDVLQDLEEIVHLDLNLGCPSKKVNAHKGGAYLLGDLNELRKIIKNIRASFDRVFTVKIRTGYKDTHQFIDSLKLFEDEGVDAITVHGRTRDELYRGTANWDLIAEAVEAVNIPIIGNGDVWTPEDIERMFKHCKCHSIMMGRGALKTPWLATLYKNYKDDLSFLDEDFLIMKRKEYLQTYFDELIREYRKFDFDNHGILSKFKSLSRYPFQDFKNGEELRSSFVRSRSLDEFLDQLYSL